MLEIFNTVQGMKIDMGLVTTIRSFLISAKIFYAFHAVFSRYSTI
jgi:hypothetical protein